MRPLLDFAPASCPLGNVDLVCVATDLDFQGEHISFVSFVLAVQALDLLLDVGFTLLLGAALEKRERPLHNPVQDVHGTPAGVAQDRWPTAVEVVASSEESGEPGVAWDGYSVDVPLVPPPLYFHACRLAVGARSEYYSWNSHPVCWVGSQVSTVVS